MLEFRSDQHDKLFQTKLSTSETLTTRRTILFSPNLETRETYNCRYKREPEVNVKTCVIRAKSDENFKIQDIVIHLPFNVVTMNIDEDADYSITPEWPAAHPKKIWL